MMSYVMEALGTFFLMLSVALTGNPLAIGLMLMAAIYGGSQLTGGHYNGAVSLAVWIRQKFGKFSFINYFLAQTAGALVALAAVMYVSGKDFMLQPPSNLEPWKVFGLECLATFWLCFVILSLVTDRSKDTAHAALIIGLTLTSLIFLAGPISGAVLNPSFALAYGIMHGIKTGGALAPEISMYLVATLTGGVLAAYVHQFLHE